MPFLPAGQLPKAGHYPSRAEPLLPPRGPQEHGILEKDAGQWPDCGYSWLGRQISACPCRKHSCTRQFLQCGERSAAFSSSYTQCTSESIFNLSNYSSEASTLDLPFSASSKANMIISQSLNVLSMLSFDSELPVVLTLPAFKLLYSKLCVLLLGVVHILVS